MDGQLNEESSPEPHEFAALLVQAKAGSDDDRAALLETFRSYLKTIAQATIGTAPKTQMSTSDLVQSAIIDAFRSFDQCRAATHAEFKAWIRQILVNDIMNRIRYLRRSKRDVRIEKPLSNQALIADELSPQDAIAQAEDEKQLTMAIEQLSPDKQQLIVLRHRDKLTFTEIGKQLNRTPDAARMMWNRAIDELAKIMGETK